MDEVRRNVQQQTLDRRARTALIRSSGSAGCYVTASITSAIGNRRSCLSACLAAGDPDGQVTTAPFCYQTTPSDLPRVQPATGRAWAAQIITSFPSRPIPEIAGLRWTLRAWRTHVPVLLPQRRDLQRRHGIRQQQLRETCRLGHGCRNFTNYRLRLASGTAPTAAPDLQKQATSTSKSPYRHRDRQALRRRTVRACEKSRSWRRHESGLRV